MFQAFSEEDGKQKEITVIKKKQSAALETPSKEAFSFRGSLQEVGGAFAGRSALLRLLRVRSHTGHYL